MHNSLRPSRLNVWHKLTLTCVLVTLSTVVLAEILGLGAVALLGGHLAWGIHSALVIVAAAVAGIPLGMLTSRAIARRVHQILEISRAWLRGNLALRIPEQHGDDLGRLAAQLNLLAEQLAEDEQDLDVLRERNTRLTDQVRALAVVEERNRLARELHDSVKQHLFSLAMTASAIRTHFQSLDSASPQSLADLDEMAREIETAAQTAQRETTRLIEDLRPGSLQEQGLATALNDYTLLFGAQEHILVYLEVQGDNQHLPPAVAEALYRVAQEALHNVAHHAKATRVDIQLHITPERVLMTVEDNGVGFDPGRAHRGLGLANMQERVMALGGRLALDSTIGVGTAITAEIELSHAFNMPLKPAGRGVYRPNLSIDNWSWLGAKLVVPVGQTWPWLPADLQHLHGPLVEPGAAPLTCHKTPGFLGMGKAYTLTADDGSTRLARIQAGLSGFEWESEGASWALRTVRGLRGRMVLTRNKQPLAAIQYQGRQMGTWSEISYDGRGYSLVYTKKEAGDGCTFALMDDTGQAVLCFEGNELYHLTLQRAIPLPLLVMTTARVVNEVSVAMDK